LRRSVVADGAFKGWTWASPFRPDSFAGVQVALQAWATGGQCLDLRGTWEEIRLLLAAQQPPALCCTPTFLGLLLLSTEEPQHRAGSGTHVRWAPQQITLGGEPLRGAVGRHARQRFPDARFTVVYATAELGIVAKTHRVDGWFEASQLEARWGGWRIAAGVLEVSLERQWRSTGDRIEIRDDCFRVIGRADAVANVGGSKVVLPEIEAAAEEVEGVWCAQALAEPNPVTGEIVVLRFSVEPGTEPDAVESALRDHLRTRLPKAAWPRRWERTFPVLGQNAKRPVNLRARETPQGP
jgi:acyl-CoA synthetase (AMP-forming)/AMP-acid ligase II